MAKSKNKENKPKGKAPEPKPDAQEKPKVVPTKGCCRRHLTCGKITLSVLVLAVAMGAAWWSQEAAPNMDTFRMGTFKTIAERWADKWNFEEDKKIMTNNFYSEEVAKMGDIVYFYGSPTQMANEILQLGFGWFLYDFVHYMGRRPMHTGVVVEVNDRKYLLHACGSKVWFQGLKAHLRYRLYVGYDIQIQPVEWENDPKHLDNIQEFLRTHVDETYRHPLNVSMLPEVPEFDSERGKKMRTEPWLFPMGQHKNYTMSYQYYKEVYGDKPENGGYTCAEIVVLFYDLVGMFDSSKGFAPVTYLPYNLLPESETFHLINAKFTQTLRLEMRDSEYFWESKSWGWWANRYYEDIIWIFGYEVPERGLYEEFTWFYGAWFNYW